MHLLALLNFTSFVSSVGYAAIFILCVLQSCCVPTSSEITLGFAGALAAQGKLSLAGVIVAGVLGEVIGAYIAWVVGRHVGRGFVDRFGRYVLLSHRDLDKAEAWYARHERFGVFGSRLLPVIRNFVALPAGIAEVPLVRFGLLTAAGSLLWDGAWAGIGYGVGTHWDAIAKGFSDIGYVLGVVAACAIAYAIFHRYRSYKDATSEESGDGSEPSEPDEAPSGPVRWIASSSGQPPSRRDDFPHSPIAAWEAAVRHGRTETSVRPGDPPVPSDDGSLPSSGGAARTVRTARHARGSSEDADDRPRAGRGQLPFVGHIFPAPLAAKVPEVVILFWVAKILSTAGGEATSDFLKNYGNIKGGAVEIGVFLLALVLQFGTERYRAVSYWSLAFAIAIFGTGVSDFLHLDVGIPYAGTTALWAVVLGAIFLIWNRSEHTLSIHSITTQRREAYYWATVFVTFALGTALGDFTAMSLHLGYLASGILFSVLILLPALAWWRFGLNSIVAFWLSYICTRPLGASFVDYISKPRNISGIGFGDGHTAIVFGAAIFLLVCYLAVVRRDVQEPLSSTAVSGARRAVR